MMINGQNLFLNGTVLNDNYDEMSEFEIEFLDEFINMNVAFILIMMEKGYDSPEISGSLIDDRKTAVKTLKVIKNWGNFKGGKYKESLDKIKSK